MSRSSQQQGVARAARAPKTPIERAAAGVPNGSYTPAPRAGGSCGSVVALTPSPYWADQLRARRSSFPPPADTTPMVRCESGERRCGRINPFYYGVGCTCEDCRLARVAAWEAHLREEGILPSRREQDESRPAGPRPARISEELAAVGATVEQLELPTEDERVLQQQIDRYLAGQPTSLINVDFT